MKCPIDYRRRDAAVQESNYIFSKVHLEQLTCYKPCLSACPPSLSGLQLLKLYEAPHYSPLTSNLTSLLLGLHSLRAHFCYLIHVTPDALAVYIGIYDCTNSTMTIRFVKESIENLEPTLSPTIVPPHEVPDLLADQLIGTSLYDAISSTTLYPPTKDFSEPFASIIDALDQPPYTILCLGEPIDALTHLELQQEITRLTGVFQEFQDITHTCTETTNDSTNNASSHAQHNQETCSSGENVGSSLSNTLSNVATQNYSAPIKVNEQLLMTLGGNASHTCTNTDNSNSSKNSNISKQSVCIKNQSGSNTETTICTYTTSRVEVSEDLTVLTQIGRTHSTLYQTVIVPPAFKLSTYFLGTSLATTVLGASLYMTHFPLPELVYYPFYINSWTSDQPHFGYVSDQLTALSHPQFWIPTINKCESPALPWSIHSMNDLFALKKA